MQFDDLRGLIFALWALHGKVPGSIPNRTNLRNELVWVSRVLPQRQFRCSGTHNARNSLIGFSVNSDCLAHYYYLLVFDKRKLVDMFILPNLAYGAQT